MRRLGATARFEILCSQSQSVWNIVSQSAVRTTSQRVHFPLNGHLLCPSTLFIHKFASCGTTPTKLKNVQTNSFRFCTRSGCRRTKWLWSTSRLWSLWSNKTCSLWPHTGYIWSLLISTCFCTSIWCTSVCGTHLRQRTTVCQQSISSSKLPYLWPHWRLCGTSHPVPGDSLSIHQVLGKFGRG